MASFRTPFSILESTASRYPTLPVFKVARKADDGDNVMAWIPITYHDFLSDVELAAKYWLNVLMSDNVPPKSVVGLWLGGMDYSDVVHIYGMSRAGYVPQLFSLRLPNPDVVLELLEKAQAKALVCDPSFKDVIPNSPIPLHMACPVQNMASFHSRPLPSYPTPVNGDEVTFIFHTSGSTSGSPKLVPCNRIWVESMIAKSAQVSKPKTADRRDVCTWMGSMCHIGQTFMLLGAMQHASCTIKPSRLDFTSEELADMVHRCELNRLHQFAAFLTVHFRHARQNPKLLALLCSLDTVLYSGMPLHREEEEFAYRAGVQLVNLFGSTECGAMMISQGGNDQTARFLRPLDGTHYEFIPITQPAKTESGHVSANSNLAEMVIMSDSSDCPDARLRRASDGHFHTGDLFQEVQPGRYVYRGRDDDWIKSLNSLRCDTRAIEDNVRATCAGLVQECIVVGSGRPSPVLFVEPAHDMDHLQLKKEIIRRTRQFHSRRYMHERITTVDCIIVVAPRSLPRTATKGNIRRTAVEEQYQQELDSIFGVDS